MKYKKIKIFPVIYLILIFNIFSLSLASNLNKFQVIDNDTKIANLKINNGDFINATLISDGNMGVYWNNDHSFTPKIVVDGLGNIHVVWMDYTAGVWGTGFPDTEIMYASYKEATGWSNATVISDGHLGVYWNDGSSYLGDIAVDGLGNIHIVWADNTDGVWGTSEYEIMYVSYSNATGWSNATVISDGYNNIYWNNGDSYNPDIAVDDSGGIHVVWSDDTDGIWGTSDYEIMYASYSNATGWSNVTVISDGYNNVYWNDGWSIDPSIAVDKNGIIHVVWEDYTAGIWGTGYPDTEILYVSYMESTGWSNVSAISDGFNNFHLYDGMSRYPSIAVDSLGNAHVVWYDEADGEWKGGVSDSEIWYSTLGASGWSFPKVISDGSMGVYCLDGHSDHPDIAVDGLDNLHVVWYDGSEGAWGFDYEIMYTYYSEKTGWSFPKVISDGYMGVYWNDGHSYDPAITYGNEELHVVWYDETDGVWGADNEIFYTNIEISLSPSDFILSTNAGSPDSDGIFNLLWTESTGAKNYSVYQHSSYILQINSSVNLIQDGLNESIAILTGYKSGEYYFIIEAMNEFGTVLSNCILVEVQVPSGGGIPFGNFYLIISIIGIIGLIIYVRRKL